MTREEQQRMLAALMASSASQPRFASVDFAGTPGLQALGAEQADIDRRRRSLFEPPVATSQQQLFPTLATHLVGAFQRNQEAADKTALLDQLPTPEITEADYEAYSSPYLAQTREAEQEAMSAPTDQGLGIDAQDFYTPPSEGMVPFDGTASIDPNTEATTFSLPTYSTDDVPLELSSAPSRERPIDINPNAIGLDAAQLGIERNADGTPLFQSQAGMARQYIDSPLGEDPTMMSALIGDPQTVGQEREQIAGDFALDQSSPRALLDRLGSVETKTRSGRNLKEQMMTNALVQDAAAAREAALLADERAEARAVADRLAEAKFIEAGIRASTGTGASSNMKDHRHWAQLSQNVADAIRIYGPESPEAKAAISSRQTFERFAVTPEMANLQNEFRLLDKVGPNAGGAPIGLGPTEKQEYIYAKYFGQKNADLAAIRDNTLYDKVESAQKVNDKVGLMLARLDTMDADFGGRLQDWKTGLNAIVAEFGDEAAMRKATDEQFMAALQGSTVFELLKILGIGARGLDTPAEREFLQEVIAGRNTLTHGALVRMALSRASQGNDIYEQWNKKTYDGSLRAWYDSNNTPEKIFASNIFLPKDATEEDVTNAMNQLEAQDRPSSRDDAIAYLYELRRQYRAKLK
jgi:hypothetical protein